MPERTPLSGLWTVLLYVLAPIEAYCAWNMALKVGLMLKLPFIYGTGLLVCRGSIVFYCTTLAIILVHRRAVKLRGRGAVRGPRILGLVLLPLLGLVPLVLCQTRPNPAPSAPATRQVVPLLSWDFIGEWLTPRPNRYGFYTESPPSVSFLMPMPPQKRVPSYVVENNSLGYRDKEWSEQADPGTRRVLVMGDSYVQGYGIPSSDGLLHRQLERELNANGGSRWEALNVGISPSGLPYFVNGLLTIGAATRPSAMVISYLGASDVVPIDIPMTKFGLPPLVVSYLYVFWVLGDQHQADSIMTFPLARHNVYRDRLQRDFKRLLAFVERNDVLLVIWRPYGRSQVGDDPLEAFVGHPNLIFMDWDHDLLDPAARTRCTTSPSGPHCSWRDDPSLAIPHDGHPTAKANGLIAHAIALKLLSRR